MALRSSALRSDMKNGTISSPCTARQPGPGNHCIAISIFPAHHHQLFSVLDAASEISLKKSFGPDTK